jgi:hypothetical protein
MGLVQDHGANGPVILQGFPSESCDRGQVDCGCRWADIAPQYVAKGASQQTNVIPQQILVRTAGDVQGQFARDSLVKTSLPPE